MTTLTQAIWSAQLRRQRVEVDPRVRQQTAHGRHVHIVALGDVGDRLLDLLRLDPEAEALGFLALQRLLHEAAQDLRRQPLARLEGIVDAAGEHHEVEPVVQVLDAHHLVVDHGCDPLLRPCTLPEQQQAGQRRRHARHAAGAQAGQP